jgi:histidine ammonia-lyase
MGMNAALKTRQILDNANGVLGIELMAAAQALDFRDYEVGKGTRAAHEAIRRIVEFLDEDRPLFPDHNAMAAAVAQGAILDAAQAAVGELEKSWH